MKNWWVSRGDGTYVAGGNYCPMCKKDGGLFYYNFGYNEFYQCENCLKKMSVKKYKTLSIFR